MARRTLADQEKWLAQRKAELGLYGRDYVMVNSGVNRTPEKRELLNVIAKNSINKR